MKKTSDKLLDFIDEPRVQKLIIIILPCLAILGALLLMAPRIIAFSRQQAATEPTAAVTPFPVASVQSNSAGSMQSNSVKKAVKSGPKPSPTPTPAPKAVTLTGSSTERDLLIMVRDEQGTPIQGEVFKVTVDYPGGESCTYDSETDGSCYVVDLNAGEYQVSLEEKPGFLKAEEIKCQVKARVEYAQIEDVDEYLDIVDSSQVSQDEVKTGSNDAPVAAVAEVLITEPETPAETVVPVLDSGGNQLYNYEFHTNAEGYLLLSSGEPSTVKLFDENGDGVPECGMQTDEYGNTSTVYLYNADNTPVSEYSITATPMTSTQSVASNSAWQEHNGNLYYYRNGSPVTGLKEIDGHLYYFDEHGIKASSLGIDVSFYNEYINWPAVKAQGIDFAIIRVGGRYWSREDVYNDERTVEYLNGAKAAGIKVGVYFYSTATSAKEAVQEASFALEKVSGYSLDYPIFIDMEYSGIYPEGRADKLTRAERAEISNAFCQTVINSGYAAGVYTGQNFLINAMDANSIRQYPLWLANYTNNLQRPSYTGSYSIWQFTDMGQVRGINGYVDMNVIF